jgi:pimeloyl-ACP methyl ester carboxylesterase
VTRWAALLAAAAVLLSGCTGAGSGSGRDGNPDGAGAAAGGGALSNDGVGEPLPPPSLSLKDCTKDVRFPAKGQPGADRRLSFACGYLTVPMNYLDPRKAKLRVFVIRARLGGTAPGHSLAVNPGGPGGSGVDTAVGLAFTLPTEVLDRYDLIGFDPRGVGYSNGIHCVPDTLKDQVTAAPVDATTEAAFAAQKALATKANDACYKKYGVTLAHINTIETAKDMDLLRQALGEEKLSYLGYSYGTLLGAVYATLFPERVGAFVLDGAVDPTAGTLTSVEEQARGFEDAFNQFAAACTGAGDCPLGADPRAFVTSLEQAARAHPIRTSEPKDTRRATDGNVLLAVVSALYERDAWPRLSEALAAARDGDAKGVLELDDQYNQRAPDGTFSNLLDVNLAVNCNDESYTEQVSEAVVRRTLAQWRRRYPMFGATLALSLLSCVSWQPVRTPLPTVQAAPAPRILVVGTRHDPATPYSSAQHLVAALRSAVLLTWEGDGHTAYPKTRCVTAAVDAYLLSGRPPAANATCPLNN